MKKIFKSRIFFLTLGMIIATTIGVTASVIYNASEVGFTPSDINWKVNNLQDAINDLYDRSNDSNCISGSFIGDSSMNTEQGQLVEDEFAPSSFVINLANDGLNMYDSRMDSSNTYAVSKSDGGGARYTFSRFYRIENNSLYMKRTDSAFIGKLLYYTACK